MKKLSIYIIFNGFLGVLDFSNKQFHSQFWFSCYLDILISFRYLLSFD